MMGEGWAFSQPPRMAEGEPKSAAGYTAQYGSAGRMRGGSGDWPRLAKANSRESRFREAICNRSYREGASGHFAEREIVVVDTPSEFPCRHTGDVRCGSHDDEKSSGAAASEDEQSGERHCRIECAQTGHT